VPKSLGIVGAILNPVAPGGNFSIIFIKIRGKAYYDTKPTGLKLFLDKIIFC
jgi:hypothetical protein